MKRDYQDLVAPLDADVAAALACRPPERAFPPLEDRDAMDVTQTKPDIQSKDEAEWPAPALADAVAPELTADMLPGWLGAYVGALARSTQTPVTMSALFALSVVATCVQRRYVVQVHEGYTESASFWSLSAAPSGSRKSAIVAALTAPIEAWEKDAQQKMRRAISDRRAQIGEIEATVKRIKEQIGKCDDGQEREQMRRRMAELDASMPEELFPPVVFSGDTTVEALQMTLDEQCGRASVLCAEGGLFSALSSTYGGRAGPSLDVLLEGFSGGAVRVVRHSRKAFVERAAVTLGLMIQPDLLADAAGSSRFRASGLMARFAFAVPGPFVGGRNVRAYTPVPDELRGEYRRCVDSLLGDPDTQGPYLPPKVIPLGEDALGVWYDFAQWVEDELAPGRVLAAMHDWGAKLAGMAARVALLFELVKSGPELVEVGVMSMDGAVRLCRALVPHTRQAFRLLAADEVDRDADHVLQWAVRGGRREFLQSEVHRELHNRFTKRERLIAALQRLQSSHCLRHTKRKNEGARASDVWLVNPALFLH
ncbi:YfjI family protein [Comamonas faecalis]|uniref:YfjI family protein n=1 Tax=Comamonas faecalis TaxID=1387849 RepID=A0ABP7RQQ3_9BURK